MEFNEKLQELRKQKGLTQEQLAAELFVSRTAVSKWESGRGYPGIDSLKAIAKLFSVTVDELLSREELFCAVEEDSRQREKHFRDLIFGLCDFSSLILLFLPIFGQKVGEVIQSVSLLSLDAVQPYLKIAYLVFITLTVLLGIMTLALQNCQNVFWTQRKGKISLILGAVGTLLFTVSLQPYAACFIFIFLMIKAVLLIKR